MGRKIANPMGPGYYDEDDVPIVEVHAHRTPQPAPAARVGATSTRPGWTFYPESDEHPAHWLRDDANWDEINPVFERIYARWDREAAEDAARASLATGPSPEDAAVVAGRVAEPDITTPAGAYAAAQAWAARQTPQRHGAAAPSVSRESPPSAVDPTTPEGAYAAAQAWAARQVAAGRR